MWILKATRDEEAYNAFMRAYENMMQSPAGLFDSIPDAMGGESPLQTGDDWVHLEDQGIIYNPKTGEAYKSTYHEDIDDYSEERIDIPTPVGAGLEGKVFRIPNTDYVVKIPMFSRTDRIRNIPTMDGGGDRMIRSPLEAYWSQVLADRFPVAPYSVFASRHPTSKKYPSLNLVQEFVDKYNPRVSDQYMNAIHDYLFGFEDVGGGMADDWLYEISNRYPEEQYGNWGKEAPIDEIKALADEYVLQGYDSFGEMPDNMYQNVLLDYMSRRPFKEDNYGGLLPQKDIDALLESAIYHRERLPKRYRTLEPGIDRRIDTIIDELTQSKEAGRLIGSSVDFADSRRDVQESNFGRGFGPRSIGARMWNPEGNI